MDDFAAFILTHGRADRVQTYKTLRKHGYTGKIYLVIDDEDKTADQYYERFGDEVLMFSKVETAKRFDEGDNFNDRRAIFYARNACFDLAEQVGVRYFIQLDDDYTYFSYRFDKDGFYAQRMCHRLDEVFSHFVDYLKATPFVSVAMGQNGDYIGGAASPNNPATTRICGKRKAMNTFFCDTEKRFEFVGRINEDVNTYSSTQRQGSAMLTVFGCSVCQGITQKNEGGMTDLYLDAGTYIKTFYSVMYAPSCVKVSTIGGHKNGVTHNRIHHAVNWNAAAPKIIRERHRRWVGP